MTDETKHGTAANNGYEHQDMGPGSIFYFLLALAVGIALSLVGLRGLYTYLDHREKAGQPAVNPLITNVPADTRHIASGYPQTAFPSPKLEEDERGQLNGILLKEERTLYSYGWVDEKAGTIHIPIERAMDLIVERGLPVRPQSWATDTATTASGANRKESNKTTAGKKGEMQ
jgi:hypothetical protein